MNKDGTLTLQEYPAAIELRAKHIANLNASIREKQAALAAKEADLLENVNITHASSYKNADERRTALELNRTRNDAYTSLEKELSDLLLGRDLTIAAHTRLKQEYQIELLCVHRQLAIQPSLSEKDSGLAVFLSGDFA